MRRRILTKPESLSAASYVLVSPFALCILIGYPHIGYQTQRTQLGKVERTEPVPLCTAVGMRRVLGISGTVVLWIPIGGIICGTSIVGRTLQPVLAERTLILIVYLWLTALSDYSVIIRRALFLCEPRLQLVHVPVLQYLVVVHVTGDTLPLDVAVLVGLHLVHAAAPLVGACAAVRYKADSVDLERSVLELWRRPA